MAISGYYLLGQRARASTNTLTYVSVVYTTAALLLVLATLSSGDSLTGYSANAYMMLALLAVGPQLIGHSALNWSLKVVPATLVAVAVLGEPVGATFWAFLFLHERPATYEMLGGAVILTGVFLAMRPTAKAGEESAESAK